MYKKQNKNNFFIFNNLDDELKEVEKYIITLNKYLLNQINFFELEIQNLAHYCLKNPGKRLRSILVFCSGYKEKDSLLHTNLIKAGAIFELVHIATLIHDDILDKATMRHQQSTINKRYGSKIAVLLGDAIFSHAIQLASEYSDSKICYEVAKATRIVCTGEIIQTLNKIDSLDITLQKYFRIIKFKTAELFKAACLVGGYISKASKNQLKTQAEYGKQLGLAYQIFDDLNDYIGNETRVGKTLGTDLTTGKITLPILLLINKMKKKDQVKILKKIKLQLISTTTLTQMMHDYDVFKLIFNIFMKYINSAYSKIKLLPNSCNKKFMIKLLNTIKINMENILK